MIRFTWLQARTQTALILGALLITAIALAITGPHLVHLYNANVATCTAHGNCDAATATFLRNDRTLRTALGILVIVVPGIIGLFWGAPLVARELESGTYRLAWTQSVSRTRWLAVKLAVVGLIGMAVAGLLSLILTWWASPFDTVTANRMSPSNFDERGIVAIGYVAFAFALGALAGAVIRRTVPAMAVTLVAFTFFRLLVSQQIRTRFIAPLHRVIALGTVPMGFGSSNSGALTLQPQAPPMPNTWIYSTRIIDNAGHALTPQYLASACPHINDVLRPPAPVPGRSVHAIVPPYAKSALQGCVAKVAVKYHEVVTYQPAKNYWALQSYELALFLGAALVLCGLTFWWVRRRLA
jgi:hypothetical protein